MQAPSSSPAHRRRTAILGGSVLAIGAASLWAWHDNLRLFATGLIQNQNSIPAFQVAYSPPTPEFRAVQFEDPNCRLLFGIPFVYARMIEGRLHIDEGKDIFPYKAGRPTKPIWRGPIAEARFTHEMIGGADTLKDQSGKILWTNGAELASPDLHLQNTESGEARLLGKKGKLLWAGILPKEQRKTRALRRGDDPAKVTRSPRPSYQIGSCGVRIRCVKETRRFRLFHG